MDVVRKQKRRGTATQPGRRQRLFAILETTAYKKRDQKTNRKWLRRDQKASRKFDYGVGGWARSCADYASLSLRPITLSYSFRHSDIAASSFSWTTLKRFMYLGSAQAERTEAHYPETYWLGSNDLIESKILTLEPTSGMMYRCLFELRTCCKGVCTYKNRRRTSREWASERF